MSRGSILGVIAGRVLGQLYLASCSKVGFERNNMVDQIANSLASRMEGNFHTYEMQDPDTYLPKQMIGLHSYGLFHQRPAGVRCDLSSLPAAAILAHDIAHNKHGDCYFVWIIPSIVFIATAILLGPWVLPPIALTIAAVAGIVSFCGYNHFAELRADREACEYLTRSEKMQYISWMKQKLKNEGESCFDIASPSLKTRIERIRTILKESK